MEVIICNCGNGVDKDYRNPVVYIVELGTFYEWRCEKCGQMYREKVKEIIYLENATQAKI